MCPLDSFEINSFQSDSLIENETALNEANIWFELRKPFSKLRDFYLIMPQMYVQFSNQSA